jgi:sec-independent protein translocase protein TatA
MFDISPIQIIIVLGIALLVFGPKRLPEMGRSIGRGIRDFKDGLTGDPAHSDDADADRSASTPAPRA